MTLERHQKFLIFLTYWNTSALLTMQYTVLPISKHMGNSMQYATINIASPVFQQAWCQKYFYKKRVYLRKGQASLFI